MHKIDGILGIVAGSGDLPREVVRACLDKNQDHHIIAFNNITEIGTYKDASYSQASIGQVGKILDILRQKNINTIIMAGAVGRPNFAETTFDFTGLRLLKRLATLAATGDDQVFRAIIEFIEQRGFRVIGADDLLPELVVQKGTLGNVTPDKTALRDIEIASEAARIIGSLDVGQAVICQQGNILGIEGAEGTDNLISRCADLHSSGKGGVLVKVRKPNQDNRVDLPSIGLYTIENAYRSGLRGIAIESGHSLIIDREAVIKKANQFGLFITGI